MITLCIRYEIDPNKLRDFEAYAKSLPEPIHRCGGDLLGYFLPTKIAGPTNQALALINFSDLTAYQRYRDALSKDSQFIARVKCDVSSVLVRTKTKAHSSSRLLKKPNDTSLPTAGGL